MIRRRDHLATALGVVAAAFFLVALIDRPHALPPDAAQYVAAAPPVVVKEKAAPGITYAIDTIEVDGKQRAISDLAPIRTSGSITIHGWAVDPRTLAPAKQLLVSIDGSRPMAAGIYGAPRPDVASVVGPSAANSGFAAVLSTIGLHSGMHRLRFSLLGQDGRQTLLPAIVQFDLAQRPAKIPS